MDCSNPAGLFRHNAGITSCSGGEEEEEGAGVASKETCFINVNTETGQKDQCPSSTYN